MSRACSGSRIGEDRNRNAAFAGHLRIALPWLPVMALVGPLYAAGVRAPMPALRLGGTVPSAELVQNMAPLAGQLAARLAQARKDEEDGVGEDEPGE